MSNSSDKDKADRGNDTPPDAPYEVRNKKPPRHGQFKPSFSGNPKGCRKEASIFARGFGQGLQSDQEATANEMAKHGEAEDIGLPNKKALRLLGERKTSSQRTSSASVIPFRASANGLSMTARNYGKDIPELREGHPRIMGRTRRNYDHDTSKLTARRAPYCAPDTPLILLGLIGS